jgi:hypothetical protein
MAFVLDEVLLFACHLEKLVSDPYLLYLANKNMLKLKKTFILFSCYLYNCSLLYPNRIGKLIASVFTCVVDRGFEPRPCETNEDKNGIYCS